MSYETDRGYILYYRKCVFWCIWRGHHCAGLTFPSICFDCISLCLLFSPLSVLSCLSPPLPFSPSVFLRTTFRFITPVTRPAKLSSPHFIPSLGTWLSLVHCCACLSPLSSPSLPEMTLSHLHIELLSSPLSPFQPSLY